MNLQDWVKKNSALPDQLEVIEGICVAVEEAIRNQEGMLSPDPSRIEVGGSREVRVRPSAPSDSPSAYTAPEIVEGRAPKANADVFSAGVIFYEMLAQRHPFPGGVEKTGVEGVVAQQPPPLRDLRPELPRDLTDAITACLERDPEWRPSDLAYLLQVVRGLKGSSGAKAAPASKSRPSGPPPKPVEVREPASEKRAAAAARSAAPVLSAATRAPGRPTPLPIIAIGAVVILAGGFYLLKHSGSDAVPTPAPRPSATQPHASLTPEPSEAPTPEPSPDRLKKSPSPSPKESPGTKSPEPSPEPRATPTPTPVATPTLSTPAPATPAPTPVPRETPLAAATPPPATPPPAATEPATITTASPRLLRRGQTTIVDVHGTGLRADHRARFTRPKDPTAGGITAAKVRLVNSGLVQILMQVDAGAATGPFSVILVDGQGQETNPLAMEVAK